MQDQYIQPNQMHQQQQYMPPSHSRSQTDMATPRTEFPQEDPGLTFQDIDYAAASIHDALHRGFMKGADNRALVKAFAGKNDQQTQEIVRHYEAKFEENLIKKIKSKCSGHLEDLLVSLCTPIDELDAQAVHQAISSWGKAEPTELIEILGYTTNEEFKNICAAYSKRYKKEMEHEILHSVSSVEKKFYGRLFGGRRDETNQLYNLEQDVELMNSCRNGKKGDEQDTICEIFTTRGYNYLPELFTAYELKYRQSIHKFISKDFSGRMEDTLIAFVEMITNPAQHVAKRFNDCFAKGTRGTDHKTLISMICRYRDPNDLDIIQNEFRNQYHCLLDTKIYEEKLGGDYGDLMLGILGESVEISKKKGKRRIGTGLAMGALAIGGAVLLANPVGLAVGAVGMGVAAAVGASKKKESVTSK